MKLSIITINYNNLSGLKKTIESVFFQTFKDFEYHIIDGGSTDGSKNLIQKHADKLAYWVSEKDNGIYHAMNKGIKIANGEYLLFLNSGDWLFDTNTLNNIESVLQDYDLIYGDIMHTKEDGTEWLHNSPAEPSLYFLGYCRHSLPHQAMFIKKSLFDKYGVYDENLKMVADWAFYLTALFKYNCSYKKINQIISFYNFEGFSSDIKNNPLQEAERAWVMNQYFKNHEGLLKEFSGMKSQLWNYEHSRLIKAFKKLKLSKL